MQGRWIAACALGAGLALWAGPAMAAGDVALFLGQRQVDDKMDPIEEAPEFGLVLTTGSAKWPVLMAIDFLYSKTDEPAGGFTADLESFELDAGVRKFWRKKFRPFAGGGASIIKSTLTLEAPLVETDSDDFGVGAFIDGGFLWMATDKLGLGLEARWSTATAQIFEDDVDLGGLHYGFLLSWGL